MNGCPLPYTEEPTNSEVKTKTYPGHGDAHLWFQCSRVRGKHISKSLRLAWSIKWVQDSNVSVTQRNSVWKTLTCFCELFLRHWDIFPRKVLSKRISRYTNPWELKEKLVQKMERCLAGFSDTWNGLEVVLPSHPAQDSLDVLLFIETVFFCCFGSLNLLLLLQGL